MNKVVPQHITLCELILLCISIYLSVYVLFVISTKKQTVLLKVHVRQALLIQFLATVQDVYLWSNIMINS